MYILGMENFQEGQGMELRTVEEGGSGLQWRERWAEVNY